MKVTVSAPGKIYLLGEHAAVYQKPALLTAINKRVTVTVSGTKKNLHIDSPDNIFIKKIIGQVLNLYHLKINPPIYIKVTSQIKSGYHLGSSAAVAVATAAALAYFLKKVWHPELINELAYKVEKLKHGHPSGADNSVSVFGGFIWYRKELDFLKNIWQLPLELSSRFDNFYLIDTGPAPFSTGQMVAYVRNSYLQNKRKMEGYFSENETLTRKIARSLKADDVASFTKLLKKGHTTLEKIGVVSRKVVPVIKEVENMGGAAKILGGGSNRGASGYLLAFLPDYESVSLLRKKLSYPFEKIKLGQPGVRLESDD